MSRRVAGLFLAAVLGLAVCLGLVLASLSWWALGAYAALVVVALVSLSRKASALRRPVDDGRTCRCCTTTVFDPVEIR